jgi:subtilisin family serine protease
MTGNVQRALCTAILIAAVALPPPGARAASASPGYAAGEVVVKFKQGVGLKRMKKIHAQHRAVVKRAHPKLGYETLALPAGTKVEDAIAAYRSHAEVALAEPNYRVEALGLPTDPAFAKQWALHNVGQSFGTPDADLDAPEAWNLTRGNPSVVVAVVDTGVAIRHPDLARKIWINAGEIPDNQVDDDGNGHVDDVYGWDALNDNDWPDDFNGHGTHCASIIAAEADNGEGIVGVAPGVKIMAVTVLDSMGQGYADTVADGLVYAVDNGAWIASLSLGSTGDSSVLRDAVRYAYERGVTVVAAAGNQHGPPVTYPAAYEAYTLAVAATDHDDHRAAFSSAGPATDIAAPGKDVYAAWRARLIGPEQVRYVYTFASGTSMATPATAGVAALVLSQNPGLTPDEVMDRVKYTAEDVNAATHPGEDDWLGFGRINAHRALTVAAHPVVTFRSLAIGDAGGNGDGRADPGESVDLTVTLANAWVNAASVTATLTSADPCVTVTHGAATFGPIAARSAASNTSPFAFAVSASCAAGAKSALTLSVLADGQASTIAVPITLGRPPILFVSDDGAFGWRLYYTEALDTLGYAYDVWDVPFDGDGPPASELAKYRVVVWNAIEASRSEGSVSFISNTFSSADVAALRAYLDGGGRLLVTSATLTKGWSMAPELLDFVSGYLHVGATSPMSTGWIAGAVGERFDGVRFAVPGVTYLDPDAQSSTLFVDDDLESGSIGRSVGTRFPSTGSAPYRVVYLGFDLHRLESADGRRYVLQRSLETLLDAPLSATPDLLPLCKTSGYQQIDTDGNGVERMVLDATPSLDPDDAALSFRWAEGTSTLSRAVDPAVRFQLGTHYLTLTCSDDRGGVAKAAVIAQVDPPLVSNFGPSIPAIPAGPSTAIAGERVTFETVTTDPEADPVSYEFQWTGEGFGDIHTTNHTQLYASGAVVTMSHVFPRAGVYAVRARAFDWMGDKLNGLDSYSDPVTITISDPGAPVISNVRVTEITGTTARVTWTTDQPSTSIVAYGYERPSWTKATDATLVTQHDVTLTNLWADRTQFLDIRSANAAGAVGVDRNLGAYYRFTTLPGTNLMHVGSIDVALLVAKTTYATATVVVVDAAGWPVPGATVSGFWMGNAGDADVGVTDAEGRVTFTSDATRGTIPRNSIFYEFRVQGVARAGWTYEETANEETSDVVQAP